MDIDRFYFRWYYSDPDDDDDIDDYDDEEELPYNEMLNLEQDEMVDIERLNREVYELISYFEDDALIKHFDFIEDHFREMIKNELNNG